MCCRTEQIRRLENTLPNLYSKTEYMETKAQYGDGVHLEPLSRASLTAVDTGCLVKIGDRQLPNLLSLQML
jgi:hypothetical protein